MSERMGPGDFDGFRELAQKVPEYLIVLDEDEQCVWTNQESLQFLVGLQLAEFTPLHLLERARYFIKLARETGQTITGDRNWLMGTDGVEVYMGTRWVPVTDRGRSYVVSLSRDLTDQMVGDTRLIANEENSRVLLHHSLDLIAVYSVDLVLKYITPNVREHLGYVADELVGKGLEDFVEGADFELLERILREEGPLSALYTVETQVRRRDGSMSTMEARLRAVESKGERFLYVNARDISARRELEAMRQNLLRADKLASLGQLAAGVAHEINNPAAFILTNLFVLREYVEELLVLNAGFMSRLNASDPLHQEYFKTLHEHEVPTVLEDMLAMVSTNIEGIERIGRIVRDLRLFSRDDGEELEVIELGEVVETAAMLVRSQILTWGHLHVEYAPGLKILGHRGKIIQVLVNLLVNASHAISLRKSAGQQVRLLASVDERGVVVDVCDTGTGIAQEDRARIFEPFFTTKSSEDGTGLGLWLCEELMKQQRGQITFETGDWGSVFSIVFPALEQGV